MLIVAAAGNPHAANDDQPSLANLPSTLSVTALDHRDQVVAAFGARVDIAAPSMLPVLPRRADGTPSFLGKTSAATPVVAGVASLLMSAYPGLRAETVRDILMRSASRTGRAAEDPGKLHPTAAFALAAQQTESGAAP